MVLWIDGHDYIVNRTRLGRTSLPVGLGARQPARHTERGHRYTHTSTKHISTPIPTHSQTYRAVATSIGEKPPPRAQHGAPAPSQLRGPPAPPRCQTRVAPPERRPGRDVPCGRRWRRRYLHPRLAARWSGSSGMWRWEQPRPRRGWRLRYEATATRAGPYRRDRRRRRQTQQEPADAAPSASAQCVARSRAWAWARHPRHPMHS